ARRYVTRHWRSLGIAVALIIAIAGTATVLRWAGAAKDDGAASTTIKARPSIAVLGFKSLSNRPDADWLSTALSEMFSTDLAPGGQLRTVRSGTASRARLELSLSPDRPISKEGFSQLHKNLGADFLVDGSYVIVDETRQLRLDLQIPNA